MIPPSMESQSAPLLETRDSARYYRIRHGLLGAVSTVRALDGVSIELFAGEVLGVVGESGCGKSTLGRLLVNMEAPTRGEVRYRGQPITGLSRRAWRPLRRRIQIAFQDSRRSLDPRVRALDQVREALEIHAIGTPSERQERAEATLTVLGLEAHLWRRFPHELSGGQCQRVVLARAMILEPEVLVCDEPTSAADVSVQAQVVNLLRELRDRTGVAILFVSHNLGLVKYLCDRVAVMYLGEVVEIAERDALFAGPRHPYTQALLSAVPIPRPRLEPRDVVIAGEPPSPTAPPSGCRFHPRCPRAEAVCRSRRPLLKADVSRRAVACHLAQADAGPGSL